MILCMLTMFHQCLFLKNLKPETKKRTSSSIELYDRQQKREKYKGLVLKQSEQSEEAAEDEINLAVQEESDKYKGWLFFPSNMDYFHFPVLLFLIFRKSLIAAFIDVFCSFVVVSNEFLFF